MRERQHLDSCLLSGFAKKREAAENSLRPLPAQGKVALKKQVPRDRRTGAATRAACPQVAPNNQGLTTCVVSRLGEEAGGGREEGLRFGRTETRG